ncbi:unnamed protein product, partial [Oikopleura dioica]
AMKAVAKTVILKRLAMKK